MNTSNNHLLVPVDYSEKSIFGLEMANLLASKYNSKVTVLNVIKGVDPIWSDSFSEEEKEILIKKLKKHLETFSSKHLPNVKTDVSFVIEKGKLCDTILEFSEKNDISTIIMGTSTVNNIKKWIIGTNALRIVAESKIPVITVKNHLKTKQIERIILPLDLTKETREKTVNAVDLALTFGAEIHVVSAQTFEDEGIKKRLDTQLDQVIEFIKRHNVSCTGRILKVRNKIDGVIEFIDYKKGDLIIITTHQHLEFVNSYLGSFAKGIIRKSNIPVMSIVPKIKHYVVFKMPGT